MYYSLGNHINIKVKEFKSSNFHIKSHENTSRSFKDIHLLNKYLLSTYYVLGTTLNSRDGASFIKKTKQ